MWKKCPYGGCCNFIRQHFRIVLVPGISSGTPETAPDLHRQSHYRTWILNLLLLKPAGTYISYIFIRYKVVLHRLVLAVGCPHWWVCSGFLVESAGTFRGSRNFKTIKTKTWRPRRARGAEQYTANKFTIISARF